MQVCFIVRTMSKNTTTTTAAQVAHTARRVAKIHRSVRNYINTQGGNFGTQRYMALQEQWDRIASLPGFPAAVASLGMHPDVNLGDLAC